MSSCPISNFIGNLCMPDPVQTESVAAKNQNFAEEASFFAAFFKQQPVIPVPNPATLVLKEKEWNLEKKRTVTKKEKCEKLWLRQHEDEEDPEDTHDDE